MLTTGGVLRKLRPSLNQQTLARGRNHSGLAVSLGNPRASRNLILARIVQLVGMGGLGNWFLESKTIIFDLVLEVQLLYHVNLHSWPPALKSLI